LAFCRFCGIEVVTQAHFCSACGRPIAPPPSAVAYPTSLPPTFPDVEPAAPREAFPLVAAALLSFAWAMIFGLIVVYQMFIGISQNNNGTPWGHASYMSSLLSIWNALVVVLYIFIGYGIIRHHPKAYSWGLGSNILNAGFGLFQLLNSHIAINVVLVPIEIAIAVILYVNKALFVRSRMPAQRPGGSPEGRQ
jgi:hypothetical protein